MFEVPAKYRPPKRVQKWPVWRRYKGKRISCDACLVEIVRGQRKGLSDSAAYSRADAESTRYYCFAHSEELKVKDGVS